MPESLALRSSDSKWAAGRPGLERVVVDEHSQPKGILKAGERKYLSTEHVKLRPGSSDEVATVKCIFQEFVRGTTEKRIARELNLRGVPTNHEGRCDLSPKDHPAMGRILWSVEVLPKTRPAGAGIFRGYEVLPKTRPAGAGIFRGWA